jgi:hypothetical protein
VIERAIRVKRKGRQGCYDCGAPTEVTVQVWMREYVADQQTASGNRKQRNVKSSNVSFCREHGEAFYARALEGVPICKPEPMQGGNLSVARAAWSGR